MVQFDYSNFTIEDAQKLYETDYIAEIIFDADNKKINIKEDEYLILKDTFETVIKSVQIVVDAIREIGQKMCRAFNLVFKGFSNYLNKKMTKKRFMKLLQAEAIERNIINKIVKDNKEPYTYMRYYITLQNFKK